MSRRKPAARLALILLLVIGVTVAADADARYRANGDSTTLARKFCEQQNALKNLPTRFTLPANANPDAKRIVASILQIQRSGQHLYVQFNCPSKVGR